MKCCDPCGALCSDNAVACLACGEATWRAGRTDARLPPLSYPPPDYTALPPLTPAPVIAAPPEPIPDTDPAPVGPAAPAMADSLAPAATRHDGHRRRGNR